MNPVMNRRNDIVTLITVEDIKVYTNISNNLNDFNIIPMIKLAQDIYVKEVLGATLYDKLMSEWDLANRVPANLRDSTQTPDGIDYKALYNQLYLSLIWWSATHVIAVTGIKIEEKGVMLNNSDYAENGGIDLVRIVEDRFRNIATTYQSQFVCYVNDTFKNDTTIKPELKSSGTNRLGIYLPITTKCKTC